MSAKKSGKKKREDTPFTKPALKRLGRRGGVKRFEGKSFPVMREALEQFVQDIIKDAVVYADYQRRNTIMKQDIVYALDRFGMRIYGFDKERKRGGGGRGGGGGAIKKSAPKKRKTAMDLLEQFKEEDEENDEQWEM